MPPPRPSSPPQTKWRIHNQQRLLIAYNGLKSKCPEGIYLSLTSGNPFLWAGIFFVRKGPYAPAVLRFHVSFPENYPNQPLLVVFKTDIFHPLVTPLTTYMAGTLTAASGSTTSDDHVPLPPGGFSLRFAFPRWFRKPQKEASLRSIESRSASELSTKLDPLENGSPGPCSPAPISKSDPVFLDQGKGMASYITSKAQDEPLYDVLLYMKSAFEDESVIDALPLDAASNSGAWHAWQAHRRKSATSKAHDATRLVESSPGSRPKVSTEWNWDGVWLGRVKKGVDASISESVLYGTTDGDDEIHFLDLDEDAIRAIKTNITGIR